MFVEQHATQNVVINAKTHVAQLVKKRVKIVVKPLVMILVIQQQLQMVMVIPIQLLVKVALRDVIHIAQDVPEIVLA